MTRGYKLTQLALEESTQSKAPSVGHRSYKNPLFLQFLIVLQTFRIIATAF